jgi:hypothetical protein
MAGLPPPTEREFQRQVIDLARLLGWRCAHFRPGRTARGWRTPVQADGAGFPDLQPVRARDGLLRPLPPGTAKAGLPIFFLSRLRYPE